MYSTANKLHQLYINLVSAWIGGHMAEKFNFAFPLPPAPCSNHTTRLLAPREYHRLPGKWSILQNLMTFIIIRIQTMEALPAHCPLHRVGRENHSFGCQQHRGDIDERNLLRVTEEWMTDINSCCSFPAKLVRSLDSASFISYHGSHNWCEVDFHRTLCSLINNNYSSKVSVSSFCAVLLYLYSWLRPWKRAR